MWYDDLIKQAILNKNEYAKEAYRAIKTEILLNNSAKKPKPEGKSNIVERIIGDTIIRLNELELSIIRKLIKQREESAESYLALNRTDLVEIELGQAKYLKDLLPLPISEERLQEVLVSAFPDGLSQKEMGKAIKLLKETFPTAENTLITKTVKNYL